MNNSNFAGARTAHNGGIATLSQFNGSHMDDLSFCPAAHDRGTCEGSTPYATSNDGALGAARDAVSAAAGRAVSAVDNHSGDGTLFEAILPVFTRLNQREDGVRSLGVCVREGRGGAHGVSRMVLVRLTDPHDPFLLFQLELLEDDYGAFKQKLELRVDFNGFPRYLVGLLHGIAHGESPLQLTFAVNAHDTASGTFRVIESNTFKTVEHVSLTLLREGDVGQKKYLAERFLHFQAAHRRNCADRNAEASRAERCVGDLRASNAELTDRVRQLEEQLKLTTSESERAALNTLREVQGHNAKELATLRESCEARIRDTQQRATEVQRQLLDDLRAKEVALEELRARTATLDASLASAQSRLRIAEDRMKLQDNELALLRSANDDLSGFKIEATRAMSENELNYVTIAERLRGALASLKTRGGELAALRDQYQKQDGYIDMLSAQNAQLDRHKEASEANLAKAHHILSNQIQTIKNAKERYQIAADQARSLQSALAGRDSAQHRLKDDLAASCARVQALQMKNSELREQLQSTDDTREKVVQELKNSQAALLHLQRSTSVNGRHWGVLSSTLGAAATGSTAGLSTMYQHTQPQRPASPSYNADLLREFSRHATTPAGSTPSTGATQHRHAPHEQPRSPSPAEQRQTTIGERFKHVPPNMSQPRSSAGLTASGSVASTSRGPSATSNNRNFSEAGGFASKSFFPTATDPTSVATVHETRASAYF